MNVERHGLSVQEVSELLDHLVGAHPLFNAEDLYKLAHQSVIGGAHLPAAPHLAAQALRNEVDGLDLEPMEWEDSVEIIHPGLSMVRVHLRPYLRSGGGTDRLVRAMFKSQELLGEPDKQSLALVLGAYRTAMVGREAPNYKQKQFDMLVMAQVSQGFNPIAHSETYRDVYDPHYRVVLADALSAEN
jgi:hypothetical protein